MSVSAKEACIICVLFLTTLATKSSGNPQHGTADFSKVEYALAADLESKNEIIIEGADAQTSSEASSAKNEDAIIKATDDTLMNNKEPLAIAEEGGTLPAEMSPVDDMAVDRKETAEYEAGPTYPLMPQGPIGKTTEEAMKTETTYPLMPQNPIGTAKSLMPKPDGKDEKPYEGEFSPDEYGVNEGKLDIGQIPILLPPFIQMLLRPRTFGGTFPVPPAVDISDRLPPLGVEEDAAVAESGDKPLEKGRSRGRFEGPMGFGLPPLPMIPLQAILRDLSGESKLPGATESEVLDVKGKKMLLQKKVLSFPSGDKSRFHLRIMSVQPLEEHADPKVMKEMGKGAKGDEGFDMKEVKEEEEDLFKKGDDDDVEEESKRMDGKVDLELRKDIEKKEGEDSLLKEIEDKDLKLFPQSDILKTEETKVKEQVFVEAGEKAVPKVLEERVGADSDKAGDELKGETAIEGKKFDAAEKGEDKNEESEGPKVISVQEKKISKELGKKDFPREAMDLGGGVFFEKKKISHEKEKKELLKKKDKKEKKCKCEEKDSDSDSDDDDKDDN